MSRTTSAPMPKSKKARPAATAKAKKEKPAKVLAAAPSLFKVSVTAADFDAARSVAALWGEVADPPPLAVSMFEQAPRGHVVEALYDHRPSAADVAKSLKALAITGLGKPAITKVQPQNWVAISQQALPPVIAGRFIIHGSHDRAAAGGALNAIEIDAGEAFGTAHHATTLGCLMAIDRLARRRAFRRVLDLGCGSGVLAIAAARALPKARITASDIDPEATRVARDNARINGVVRRLKIVTAKGLEHAELRGAGPFDLLIANILAAPLIKLAPKLAPIVARGGCLVLSGLLAHQAPEVVAAYRAAGFFVARHDVIAGWATLTLVRR
jgi:ribosomal protein L11 methyltransferase